MMAARKILKKQIFCYRWFVKSGTLAWASATVTSTTSGSSPRRAASPARLRARWRGSDQVAHRWGDIRPRGLHRTQPLGMDVGAPGRAEQARLGQLDLSNSRGRVRSYDDIAPRKSTPGQKAFRVMGRWNRTRGPPAARVRTSPGGRARRRPGRGRGGPLVRLADQKSLRRRTTINSSPKRPLKLFATARLLGYSLRSETTTTTRCEPTVTTTCIGNAPSGTALASKR